MPKNIIEKIWEKHVVSQKEGHPAIFYIDLLLMHEVTSAQAFAELEKRELQIRHPEKIIATIDHSIPTRKNRTEIYDEKAKKQVNTLRENALKNNIPFYDFESGHQGIVHVIGPELGATKPGMTIACGDSHTATHGAFGALAFGVGTSEIGHILSTQCLLQQKPKTFKVELTGTLRKGVYSKDIVMKLIETIGIAGGNGHIIEYTGDTLKGMSMEARMSICNMSIECGARAGLISPDEVTFEYLKGRPLSPKGEDFDKAKELWLEFRSDQEAKYDKEITINVNDLHPMVTWGTNPEQATEIHKGIPLIKELPETHQKKAKEALEYVQLQEGQSLEGVKIDWAFIGSCTNGRIEDLRIAASMIQGKKVADGVTCYIVPGSEEVRNMAIEEGLDTIFTEAGADFRMPGCSLCLGMNDDRVPAGKRCISSSNRNFIGRQGTGSFTHLASPATVIASAITGKITSPETFI